MRFRWFLVYSKFVQVFSYTLAPRLPRVSACQVKKRVDLATAALPEPEVPDPAVDEDGALDVGEKQLPPPAVHPTSRIYVHRFSHLHCVLKTSSVLGCVYGVLW